jgi:CheY-like chemotaxis protein
VWARLQGIPVPKILVADDNANIQKMVVLAFEERGIQVVTVGNGEAAVRRIPDLLPDLVLADIFMPVRNGYEVCEFVKKDERFSHVPVILLVGAFDPLDEKEARRVGADGVLKKPFVPPDPLIAMVMSALEKNPKVAAEMAKAKAAKEVLPAEPMPHLEIPARPELKPQPDFPEPTPEEAALVYGFGKGVRALDDEKTEAVVEAKAPVAETEEADEADFDAAATTRDWRRNAMDFEVPAEAANMPAFSADENLEPATFPSERDYPPRHVRISDPVDEAAPVAQEETPSPVVAESSEPESSASEFFSDSAAASQPESAAVSAPMPSAAAAAAPEVVPESYETPAVEPESKSEPSSSPSAAHWMDALAPTQSGNPSSGWMNSLSVESHEAASSVASSSADEPVNSDDTNWSLDEPIEDQPEADAAVDAPDSKTLFPVSHAVHEEPSVADGPSASAPAESWFAPTPSVFESDRDLSSDPVAIAPSQTDDGLEVAPVEPEPPVALRDPALVEPPAVHVTPEPLLMESEEPSGPSDYGKSAEVVPPLHSYFAPASGSGYPVVAEPFAGETPSFKSEENPLPAFEVSSSNADERIPTGPPPNREALAGIPFLTPPPDFRQQQPEVAAMNTGTVDEVVRKVLERLEPQIHDMLSKGVLKPLVENLLQSELAKKGK